MVERVAKAYAAKPLPETGFVRLPTVLAVYPVSRTAWYAGMKAGLYPKPVKLGSCTAWRAEDIRALIEQVSKDQSGKPLAA